MTMLVRDIMRKNVISIPSTTSIHEARRVMDAHNIRRLPVINGEELVGIVTQDDLDKLNSSELPTYSFNELVYMRNKMTIEDVMHHEVVTVTPKTTAEAAVNLAQTKKVGSLLVKENNKIVGILTTNDFFLGILNPLLGIGLPGSRITVQNCCHTSDLCQIMTVLNELKARIINLFINGSDSTNPSLIIHLNTDDPTEAEEALTKLGFQVELRER
jgi:acetoin utilization protein AcuB